ncbi:MAG: hypothetical protein EBX11_06835 [Actinobacteria bacterium]|nr:hypothetical protein [Actinomycetota bacterium]
MIKQIYDKSGILLHQVCKRDDFNGRQNLCSDENFLQCASLKLNNGETFKPHKHLWKKVKYENYIAQESWVVIQGKVKVFFYDLENNLIAEEILEVGDASFTFFGGHNYLSLEDNTCVYEYKTGPYEGIENDKQRF